MKKTKVLPLILFLSLVSALTVSAQKSVVLETFLKHGIDADILHNDYSKQPENYAFDLKQTTIVADKEGVTEAKFDPSKPEKERWTVISVDGKTPSRAEINSFRKNQNKESGTPQPEDASYKVEKETPEQLVISYKMNPNTLTKENSFIKDCVYYMTINLQNKRLEQIQSLNEKPVKVKILKADKLDLLIKISWNEQYKRYFPVSQSLKIEAKFIGQPANVQTISEYTNYTM